MLVCNVALRARRTIAVEILEVAGAAEDIPGVAGFALLIDEPASARDALSAFTGEVLREAANATDSYAAGRVYAARLDEPAAALDVTSAHAPTAYSATITEAAVATDAPSAIAADTSARALSASRAGLGSMVAGSTGGKTQMISDIGAVS